MLAATSSNGRTHLWDVTTGGTVQVMEGHDIIWAVVWSPDTSETRSIWAAVGVFR